MDFFEVVKVRQSIRAYCDQPVEPEKLQAMLDTINRAPSAGNLQGYEVYLVTNRSCLQALARSANGQDFITQASLAVVFCAHPSDRRRNIIGAAQRCIAFRMRRLPAPTHSWRLPRSVLRPCGWAHSMTMPCDERSASAKTCGRSLFSRSAMLPKSRTCARADRSTI